MAKRKSRKSGSKHKTGKSAKREERQPIWPIVVATVALLAIVVAIVYLISSQDRYPEEATYQEALNAFRARGVSEVILPDLAADFSAGNLTLEQLDAKYPGFEEDIRAVNRALKEGQEEILATVDGEPITRTELEAQLALLPPDYRAQLSEEQVLQQMIDERLLLREAERRGIATTPEELDEAYQGLLEKGGLTDEQLAENLATLGLDEQALRRMLDRQLKINALFNETIDGAAPVTEEEAQAFYDGNRELFTQEGQVTVRHILIAVDNRTDDATAHAKAEEALARYRDGEDFCALVTEYTKDLGSKGSCGEYTFGKGVMVPEFEQASFSLAEGETTIVKTVFGYHVLLKMGETPGSILPFSLVKDSLIAQLEGQARLERYKEFIAGLRANATISMEEAETAGEGTIAPPAGDETQETAGDEPPQLLGAEPVAESDGQASAGMTVTVTPTAGEGEMTEPSDMATFASCLRRKGAVLYVADWATDSRKEATRFGDGESELEIVDCTEGCVDVDAFPAWRVSGELRYGSLSFRELSELTGCRP